MLRSVFSPVAPGQCYCGAMRVLKVLTNLLKAIAWPAIILLAFVEFGDDIKRTVHLLPCSIANANKLEVGPLKFEIKEQARQRGTPELADTIGKLPTEAIVLLLRIPSGTYGFAGKMPNQDNLKSLVVPNKEKFQLLSKLEQQNLVEFKPHPLADFIKTLDQQHLPKRTLDTSDELRTEEFDVTGLDEKIKMYLSDFTFNLSEKGKQAFSAVVSAINNQLNGTGPGSCG